MSPTYFRIKNTKILSTNPFFFQEITYVTFIYTNNYEPHKGVGRGGLDLDKNYTAIRKGNLKRR